MQQDPKYLLWHHYIILLLCPVNYFVQDIMDFAKDHPRLDSDRVGINAMCFGGLFSLHAVSRIPNLPIRCINVQRPVDFLHFLVNLKMPNGSSIKHAE